MMKIIVETSSKYLSKKKPSDNEEEEEKEITKVSKLNQEKSSLPPKEEKFNYNFKDMILTQNIIEGNWSLNSQTKHLISLNLILYHYSFLV